MTTDDVIREVERAADPFCLSPSSLATLENTLRQFEELGMVIQDCSAKSRIEIQMVIVTVKIGEDETEFSVMLLDPNDRRNRPKTPFWR